MISVKMDQTAQAARWKLTTSIEKPIEDDIESLALVRWNLKICDWTEIWDENMNSLTLFSGCRQQWQHLWQGSNQGMEPSRKCKDTANRDSGRHPDKKGDPETSTWLLWLPKGRRVLQLHISRNHEWEYVQCWCHCPEPKRLKVVSHQVSGIQSLLLWPVSQHHFKYAVWWVQGLP